MVIIGFLYYYYGKVSFRVRIIIASLLAFISLNHKTERQILPG